jgi:hypothetical protein
MAGLLQLTNMNNTKLFKLNFGNSSIAAQGCKINNNFFKLTSSVGRVCKNALATNT